MTPHALRRPQATPVTVIAALLSGLVSSAGCAPPQPTDDELRDRFAANRPGFDRLAEMTARDRHIRRLAHDWAANHRGERYFGPTRGFLDVEGWGEYRQHFVDLEIDDGFQVAAGAVWLLASTRGGDPGSMRGYAYFHGGAPPTSKCVPVDIGGAEIKTCLTALSDGWYLFRRGDPD